MKEIVRKNLVKLVSCSIIMVFIATILTPIIVTVKYPDFNMQIQSVNDIGATDLDTKRWKNNAVYANMSIFSQDLSAIRILFMENREYYQFEQIEFAFGELKAENIQQFTDSNIELHDLNCEIINGVMVLSACGENPYIQIGHIKRMVLPAAVLNMIYIFCISFIAFCLCLKLKEALEENYSLHDVKARGIFILKFLSVNVVVICILYEVLVAQDVFGLKKYHAWEVLYAAEAMICFYILIAKNTKAGVKNYIISLVMVFPFLLLSIWNISTYLTVDEINHVREGLGILDTYMTHWAGASSRINYMTMGTIGILITKCNVSLPWLQNEQFMKLNHWFLGVILIFLIVYFVVDHVLDIQQKEKKVSAIIIATDMLFSIPLVITSIKNYTYDMYSLLLSLAAVILLLSYYRKRTKGYLYVASCMATMALLEKRTAIFCWLACVIISVVELSDIKRKITYLKNTIILLCEVFFTIYINQVYVMDILSEVICYNNPFSTFEVWNEFLRNAVAKIINTLRLPDIGIYKNIIILILLNGMIIIGAFLFSVIKEYVLWKKSYRIWNVMFCGGTLLFMIIGIGMAWNTDLNPEISRGSYFLNYCREFVRGIPTCLLIISIIILIKKALSNKKEIINVIIFLDTVVVAIGYTVINNTEFTNMRYLVNYSSIFILMICIYVLQIVCMAGREWIKKGLTVGIAILNLAELSGSLPAFSFFYPIWYTPVLKSNEIGVYAYWGEGCGVAGEKLVQFCTENGIRTENVILADSYLGAWHNGAWLTNEYGINTVGRSGWVIEGYNESLENTYFVFESQTLLRNEFPYGLPQNIEPVFTINYRGTIAARIYKGTDLKEYFEQYNR